MEIQMEIEPLRSLDDFLLASSRFELPHFSDLRRMSNRIINNLVYYQTNYFLSILFILLAFGVKDSSQIGIGFLGSSLIIFLVVYGIKCTNLCEFAIENTAMCIGGSFVALYFVISFYASLPVFCRSISWSIAVVFLHSSMRLRNAKNKLSNMMEKNKLKRTMMGWILEEFGLLEEGIVD